MKKEKREIYRILTAEIDGILCDFCHYCECIGGESPCDCGEGYCIHPLKDYFDTRYYSGGPEPGDDCWGFRPNHPVSFVADVIGVVLSNGWGNGYYLWKNKKEQWKMAPIMPGW